MDTIVLLHGWGSHPAVFEALRARLAVRYEVRTPALSGYCATQFVSSYTLEALAAAIAAAAPARCHVAGWSLGGQVALEWTRTSPQQVGRLVLLGTTPSFVQRVGWHTAIQARVLHEFSTALERDSAGALTRFVSLQARNDVRAKSVARCLRECLGQKPAPRLEALTAGLRLLSETDLRAVLPSISADVLVVHGDRDGLVPVAAGEYLAHTLPAARLCNIRGAAHAPFVSDPDSVARAMLEFLDG